MTIAMAMRARLVQALDNASAPILIMVPVLLGSPMAALAQDDVDSATWLSGCWVASAGDVRSEEVWMKPDGGLMVGYARRAC